MWARDSLGGISADKLGEGNCESRVVARQLGRHVLPRDIKMSRRALWPWDCLIEEHGSCSSFGS